MGSGQFNQGCNHGSVPVNAPKSWSCLMPDTEINSVEPVKFFPSDGAAERKIMRDFDEAFLPVQYSGTGNPGHTY